MINPKIQAEFDEANNIVFKPGLGCQRHLGFPDYRSKNGLYTNDQSDKPAEYY